MTNIDFSFFLYLFFLLSAKFKRAAGYCRLGSYTGHNTRPSSYSPSCPSLTKQSPSGTPSSDRRRPLGLCQEWVMSECWTRIREEKEHTIHRRAQVRKGYNFHCLCFFVSFKIFFGKEHAGIMREMMRRGRKELKEKESSFNIEKARGEINDLSTENKE